jgi:spermidine synthase
MNPVFLLGTNMSAANSARSTRRSRARAAKKSETPAGSISGQPPSPSGQRRRAVLASLLFVSGFAALVYQLLWIKQLSLIVGVEVYAITTAVSAFFAGLALGGWIFGRLADRSQRPLRLYAALEFGIALSAVAVTILLADTASPFALLERRVGFLAWLPLLVLVAVPACLMGGTLPVLVRARAPESQEVANAGGILYAANTAGAVLGALSTPFFLIPQFGVRGTSFAAATLNVAIALLALYFDSSNVSSTSAERADEPSSVNTAPSSGANLALSLYAAAGGIALGYEIVWSQAAIQLMSTRTFAFAIVLATYLAGLVLGSAIYSRFADRVRNPWGMFGLLIASAGLLAFAGVAGIGRWFLFLQFDAGQFAYAATASEMAEMCARFFIVALFVVFPATLLLGAAFPAAMRLAVDAGYAGRGTGAVVALNTAGGVLGTFLTGFFLVPHLGIVHSLALLAISSVVVGAIAVARAHFGPAGNLNPPSWVRGIPAVVVGIAIAIVCIAIFTPSGKLADLVPRMHGSSGQVIFHEDDAGGSVVVVQEPAGFRRLFIQGVSNSGDSLPSLRYMRLQALLPLLIHTGEPKSVLVIGLGTAITAGATLVYPGLQTRVVDELLPGVVRSAAVFHGNFGVGSVDKIEIRRRDGRRDLLQSSQRYDVITLEPPPPSASGVVNLYSRDFYALAATRLEPDGIMAQWLPIATQNDDDTRSLVRSFIGVFPNASLWTTELHEMLLVGSLQPLELDMPRITTRFSDPRLGAALAEVGIDSPAALMSTWVCGREGLAKYASDFPPVTDDKPRIEYAPWVRPTEITKTLPELLSIRTAPPLRNADESFWSDVAERRERLLFLYSAGIAAYNGDKDRWFAIAQHLKASAESDPYSRWMLGADSPQGAAARTSR